jgi:hypothetical protein
MKNFRLTEAEEAQLEGLAAAMGCSQTDVVRRGLTAVQTLLDQGYRWRSNDLVLRSSPAGKTLTIFEVGASGGLRPDGEATWTDAPADE